MATKVSLKLQNTTRLPLVAMRGVILFPDTLNHFDVGRLHSIAAIEQAMKSNSPIFLVAQRDIAVEDPTMADLYKYGIVAEVQQILRLSEHYIKVLVRCKYRARLIQFYDEGNMYAADVKRANVRPLQKADKDAADALTRAVREQLEIYFEHYPKLSSDIMKGAFSSGIIDHLADYLAFNLTLDYTDKQSILDSSTAIERLRLMHDILVRENNILRLERDINEKAQGSIDQNQREYYLREQMKAISSELGETGDVYDDAEEYRKKIKLLPLEEIYISKLLREVDRLLQTPSNSQESAVIRTYLDTITELPWTTFSKDNYDIKHAEFILNRDHYGLAKVKERILEYLAVRSLTGEAGGSIICLIGPPGVGKTSIASSIAESLGRKFVRVSLGGIRDESEIRGHRRTYVASMPGRIISAIEQAQTANPLILLDEVDKLGNDFRGDPASALLEVLDPEQNNSFRDHFLDVPFDLSKVLFLTTANDASGIPSPLYDRMDVIELSSYTREEKFKIAKLHLLKKQIKKNGLTAKNFFISDRALYAIIDDYTREAGVRNLERSLASLARKAAKLIVSGENTSVKVTHLTLPSLLGAPANHGTIVLRKSSVGVVNGLAWTSVGGEVMPIETTVIKGNGKVEITGSLGDVMKESAKLALTYVRTLPESYGIPKELLTAYDIHIHAPEGAVPKDGPSAGVTLATALVSTVCDIPVRSDLAMTGEITLKGRVLPIGGLKEKLIAAYKEKLNTVLIPKDNFGDLQEISKEIRDALTIIPVGNVAEVLKYALTHVPEPRKKSVSSYAEKMPKMSM